MKKIKLIVGLGNPGEEYKNSRHNAGFMMLEKIAEKTKSEKWRKEKKFLATMSKVVIGEQEIFLMKPDTFMNLSGMAVQAWQKYYKVEKIENKILVIYDDLDLPFGVVKMTTSSPHGHNGISSIKNTLKINEFQQLRLGIDEREGERNIPASDYVLQNFSMTHLARLKGEMAEIAMEKIKKWL